MLPRRAVSLLVALTLPVPLPAQAALAPPSRERPGDCNRDCVVRVDELARGAAIALGWLPLTTCAAFDRDGRGGVTVDELIRAVLAARDPPAANWVIALAPEATADPLSPALLGQYDLSGSLFQYDRVPGLVAALRAAGFAEWRVGLGRWELATLLLPALTDGTSCAAPLAGLPPQAFAPPGSSDLDLLLARDWFRYTDGRPVTHADTTDDGRYALSYLRAVLDVVTAFGAAPYVSIDLTPRALSAGTIPTRSLDGPIPDPCFSTFTNRVSNVRPADADVFAAAVTGVVRRIVEGDGDAPGRAVDRWEIWNEPELPYFWDRRFESEGLSEFFRMAGAALVALDAYRSTSTHPAAGRLRFGLGSFASAAIAATALDGFDRNPLPGGSHLPVDFFSFHSYDNDPLAIVADIETVARARAASLHYRAAELVLAEWGPQLDGAGWDAASMDQPLHAATVIALGAAAGLDRAHHAIFWDFYPNDLIRLGLLAHDVQPRPLYHAYALLARVIAAGAVRLVPPASPDNRLDGRAGAVLASRDAGGRVRVLLVNRTDAPRRVRLDVSGQTMRPSHVSLFDDPATPPRESVSTCTVDLPGRSIAVLDL